jgi:hypothetical protein
MEKAGVVAVTAAATACTLIDSASLTSAQLTFLSSMFQHCAQPILTLAQQLQSTGTSTSKTRGTRTTIMSIQ